jgi:hypothetical protein
MVRFWFHFLAVSLIPPLSIVALFASSVEPVFIFFYSFFLQELFKASGYYTYYQA